MVSCNTEKPKLIYKGVVSQFIYMPSIRYIIAE